MTDERWTEADDAYLALHALPEGHPVRLSFAFHQALEDLEQYADVLAQWVTPESAAAWGDFSAAKEALVGQDLSIISTARQHQDVPDVAYVWLIREPSNATARMAHEPELVAIGAIYTWVWRPELAGWRLHSIGSEMPDANTLPRTSPGDAPEIGSLPA